MGRQFVVLMLRNAKLTADTVHELTLNLSIMENTEELADRRLYLQVSVLNRVIYAIMETTGVTTTDVV